MNNIKNYFHFYYTEDNETLVNLNFKIIFIFERVNPALPKVKRKSL